VPAGKGAFHAVGAAAYAYRWAAARQMEGEKVVASLIADTWIYATMLIENDWGEFGTGFLVSRPIDTEKAKIFLVSNKHVLNRDPRLREQANEIKLHLNFREPDGTIVGKSGILPLNLDNGSKRWREHPELDVDVIAFDVTQTLVDYPQVERKWATYSDFVDKAKLGEMDITIGEEIIVIGYPEGLKQGKTNFPIVRSGIIATQIGEPLIDYVEENGTKRQKVVRGFLIDGATIPGSSGSPVVLKPVTGRAVKGNIVLGIAHPMLLGIVSETLYSSVKTAKWNIPSFAGLGLALDANTIKETIELFFE
jgi:S1-C subfamily serine protease